MPSPIWNTEAGSLGLFPANSPIHIQLSATVVSPATSLTYKVLSGKLPLNLTLSLTGLISGTIDDDQIGETIQFCIRATDNLGNLRDRTFSITVGGTNIPQLTSPAGLLISLYDSIWTEFNVNYYNPISTNPINFKILSGNLPDGLEINNAGLIRGYPLPPVQETGYASVTTTSTSTSATNNAINVFSTVGIFAGRTVVFSSSVFGGIIDGQVYYVKSVLDSYNFTISLTQNGPEIPLSNGTGFMVVTLPAISFGSPIIRTYTFNLMIDSPFGGDIKTYSINVINQNLPVSSGGLGTGIRTPVLYNTKPSTYDIEDSEFFRYYVLPPATLYGEGGTYPLTTPAPIGKFNSGEYFAWKAIGYDYDNNSVSYQYVGLPLGLTIDYDTGWITGTPTIPDNTIQQFDFSVIAYNSNNPLVSSPETRFSMILTNNINGDINWVSPSDLGDIYNGSASLKFVEATCDVELLYSLVGGSLPPNLSLSSNGEIVGVVAWQPTSELLDQGDETTFTFTVRAYSPDHSVVMSDKVFTLTVVQEFAYPTDNLYIKAAPSISDRNLIASLLFDDSLIPRDYLFRPDDPNFGKANSVIYAHAYGIKSSSIQEYIAAVQTNHYWRSVTLGTLSTAVARDENGEVIYEVVYSNVIDNLINPEGKSIPLQIRWPYLINLGLGAWYTSVTSIFSSYSLPDFYTSLTPGYTRVLYPNSLPDMRDKVRAVLGPDLQQQGASYYKLLPLWMTSQQESGGTLGYVPAWVICYTKPGYSAIIKNNIETLWKNSNGEINKLNQINFQLDRFTVDKSSTYNWNNYVTPANWSTLPSGQPVPNPEDSRDFYVLYPRKTILPN